ncbi:Na(+)/H(+) exchange regulatory cofactor NHE-RF3 [Pelodytes ibericus]
MSSHSPPRECSVTKQDGKGYGFFLRIEKDEVGHLVRTVEKGSSADKAGLKDGDRVLRVNGTFVDEKEHTQVVELIKNSGNSVTLLVLDEVSYENAKKKGEDLSKLSQNSQPAKPSEVSQPPKATPNTDSGPKPRICYLVKDGSYGFSLNSAKGTSGVTLTSVAPNGIAAKAGIRNGDRIIEVNGKNVENDSQEKITSQIKESGTSIVFLVSDKETDDYFSSKNLKLTAEKATLDLLPSKPKIVELKKNADGYGFYLRQEKNRRGHFIMEIDAGSPAEKAKLKDYDRIVAVNGESVENHEHEQVVEAIRKGGEKTKLLIADKKTDELFTKAGISPFLFLQDSKEETKTEANSVVTPAVVPTTKPAAAITAVKPTPAPVTPDPKHKPRLVKLQKGTNGYGFHLNAIKEVPGQFIKQVVKGGAADVAGVKEDDVLLEVNGVNVETDAYENVVLKVKNAGANMTMLVITQESYEYFKAQKIPITASLAAPVPEKETPPKTTEPPAPTSKAKSAPEPIEMATSPNSEDKPKTKKEDNDDTQL